MTGPWTRSMVLFVLLFGAVGVASALQRVSQANTPTALATEMRDELRVVRSQVDACLMTQDRMELRFQSLTRETRGLREELDFLEGLDPRGVPSNRYERYLNLVDRFNASIPEWEQQAVDLRQTELRCRALIGIHNTRADSLQRFLVDHGIWDEAWILADPLPEAFPDEEEAPEVDEGEGLPTPRSAEIETPAS